MANETKPIKRSPELTPLSRDHHDGLLLCWKIRTGIKHGIDYKRINDYVQHFFQQELEPHFREEEDIIFILLPDDDPLKNDAVAQHAILRNMVRTLREAPSDPESVFKSFADLLDDHIRFEERQLFPYIENAVQRADLEQAGIKLNEIHDQAAAPAWPDEFWIVDNRKSHNGGEK